MRGSECTSNKIRFQFKIAMFVYTDRNSTSVHPSWCQEQVHGSNSTSTKTRLQLQLKIAMFVYTDRNSAL